ncbi:hypothetical protein AB0392_36850, partial [Nonomuraea angiospora]
EREVFEREVFEREVFEREVFEREVFEREVFEPAAELGDEAGVAGEACCLTLTPCQAAPYGPCLSPMSAPGRTATPTPSPCSSVPSRRLPP